MLARGVLVEEIFVGSSLRGTLAEGVLGLGVCRRITCRACKRSLAGRILVGRCCRRSRVLAEEVFACLVTSTEEFLRKVV